MNRLVTAGERGRRKKEVKMSRVLINADRKGRARGEGRLCSRSMIEDGRREKKYNSDRRRRIEETSILPSHIRLERERESEW